MDVLWIVLSGVAGLAIGSGCMVGLSKAGLNKNQQKAEQILKEDRKSTRLNSSH